MQMLFLDESGTAPNKNDVSKSPYFVLGGIIVPEAQWKSLQRNLRQTKKEYNVDGEIKWRYFIYHPLAKRTTPTSHLDQNQLDNLRDDLYQIIARTKSFRLLAAVVDTKAYYQRHPSMMLRIYIMTHSRSFVRGSSITYKIWVGQQRGPIFMA